MGCSTLQRALPAETENSGALYLMIKEALSYENLRQLYHIEGPFLKKFFERKNKVRPLKNYSIKDV